jgi:hypothetical protein
VVILHNKQGDSLEVTIRLACPDEAPQLITLLKKQYGSCYYDAMYDEERVRHALTAASLRLVVAELTDGTIAGMIGANSNNDFPGSLLFSMLVIENSCRGFGLGEILSRFLMNMDLVAPDTYTCIYGHIITLDTFSQATHYNFGYRMTGLLLNCYIYDREAEYMTGLPLPFKDSLLVACLPQGKKDAGTFHVAAAHAAYITEVYKELGVRFTIITPAKARPAAPLTRYSLHQDEKHNYGELFIWEAGLDFSEVLEHIVEQYTSQEQTFNVFINLNDPACPYAGIFLENRGFFFTGVQPLSGEYEYLIFHYSRAIGIPFEQIAVIPEFRKRFTYIKTQYKEAQLVRKN